MLVTANFDALNGHCIQDIETWDDVDEAIAQEIAGRVLAQQSIVAHGDDAQLLAGVNLAAAAPRTLQFRHVAAQRRTRRQFRSRPDMGRKLA